MYLTEKLPEFLIRSLEVLELDPEHDPLQMRFIDFLFLKLNFLKTGILVQY
jgi:hypothetical protein